MCMNCKINVTFLPGNNEFLNEIFPKQRYFPISIAHCMRVTPRLLSNFLLTDALAAISLSPRPNSPASLTDL